MGLSSRLKRGWRIGTQSARILFGKPKLLVFPILNLLVLGGLGVGALVASGRDLSDVRVSVDSWIGTIEAIEAVDLVALAIDSAPLLVALVAVGVVLTWLSTFFSAGLVYCAYRAIRGEPVSIRGGFAAALRSWWKITVWAFAAATVGLIEVVLEEWHLDVASFLFGLSWAIGTYFIVPVMVIEETSARSMFPKSADRFRDTWGESVSASAGVGFLAVVALLVAIGLPVGLVVGLDLADVFLLQTAGLDLADPSSLRAADPVVGGLLALYGLFLTVLVVTLKAIPAIATTGLYVYAETGSAPDAFDGFGGKPIFT